MSRNSFSLLSSKPIPGKIQNAERSKSQGKIVNSNFSPKKSSVPRTRPGKISPDHFTSQTFHNSSTKFNPSPSNSPKKPEHKPFSTLFSNPLSSNFLPSKQKVVQTNLDIYKTRKKSQKPSTAPTIYVYPNKLIQKYENKPNEVSILNPSHCKTEFTNESSLNNSVKHESYTELLNSYESEKVSRKHFEKLHKKQLVDQEVLKKKVENLKFACETLITENKEDMLLLDLHVLKKKKDFDIEKLVKKVERQSVIIEKYRKKENELLIRLDSCVCCKVQEEKFLRYKEQSQRTIKRLLNEINAFKSHTPSFSSIGLRILTPKAAQPAYSSKSNLSQMISEFSSFCRSSAKTKSFVTEDSPESSDPCKGCKIKISKLQGRIYDLKSKILEIKIHLKKKQLMHHIEDKMDFCNEIGNDEDLNSLESLKEKNSELYVKIFEQAKEIFECKKELTELRRQTIKFPNEKIVINLKAIEIKELKNYTEYLLSFIHSLKEKINKFTERYKESFNKQREQKEVDQGLLELIVEMSQANIKPLRQ